MSLTDIVVVAVSGVLAGLVNTIAGGGTLITFPALLATGMPALTANITSSVGLVSGYVGGSVGYRRELHGQRHRLGAFSLVAAVGGVAGAVVLLVTPADAFRIAVPYLVLVSCALLLVQPRLSRAVARRRIGSPVHQETTPTAHAGVFVSAVYGSYFGAGLGVLLLGVLGILLDDDLQRLNGLKSALSLVIKIVGVAVFVVSGRVYWLAAAILFATAYGGGLFGAVVARALPPAALRYTVALLGTGVAVALLILD